MKQFLNYILEQDLNDLKDQIIQNIKNTSNTKILRKISKFFELDDKGYEDANNFILDYLTNRCGYNKKITTNIKMQIKHCGAFGLCKKLFEPIKDDSSKDLDFLTSNKLIHGNNLFKLIKDYARSVLKDDPQYDEIDDEFDELIKLIADFDIGGKVATGKMEFLTSMFLKDLNKKNQATQGKVVCDINAKDNNGKDIGFEYKVSGGRITGNKEETKPLSSKVMTDKFREIIIKELRNDGETDTEKNKNQNSATPRNNKDELDNIDVDNEEKITSYINLIQNQDNLFRNGQNNKGISFEKVFEPLFDFGFSEDKVNDIIFDCLLAQLPRLEVNKEERKYLLDKYPIAINKSINDTSKNNFKQIFLILHLCNYWQAEKWDYLILFEKPDKKDLTGKYHVIYSPSETNIIKSMDKNIDGKAYSGAFPAYGEGTNDQNQAPIIKYKNKS